MYERLHSEANLSDESFSDVFALNIDDFTRVHTYSYINKVVEQGSDPFYLGLLRATETPLIHETVELQAAFTSGTYTAGVLALENGIAMNLAGGLHHAMPNREEGFCIFNDTAIAIRKLQAERKIETAMIIDGDVHQGNGNATVFLNDSSVTIADVNQNDAYPSHKVLVTYNFPFDSSENVTDEKYLPYLAPILNVVEITRPDIVFYLAGADPYKEDMLGDFQLTKEGLKTRDETIIFGVRKLEIPLVVLPAGGYSRNPKDIVDIHYNTALIVALQK